MKYSLLDHKGITIGIGYEEKPLLTHPSNSNRLVEVCLNTGIDRLVLYPENLPEGFFDLSTGTAGEVLGKLRNYQIRLAVVRRPGLRLSSRFSEMLADEKRWGYFRLFDTLDQALAWHHQHFTAPD